MKTQTQTLSARKPNGVPVDQLAETMRQIRKNEEIARFEFRLENRWLDGGHNRGSTQGFFGALQEDSSRSKPFVFDADEPPCLLGENKGANPVEIALMALSGCLTTSLVYHAAALGIELDSVSSSYEGDLDLRGFLGMDPSVRNGYEQVRVTFRIERKAPREKLEELVRIAQQRSPVFDVFTNPVPVKIELA